MRVSKIDDVRTNGINDRPVDEESRIAQDV